MQLCFTLTVRVRWEAIDAGGSAADRRQQEELYSLLWGSADAVSMQPTTMTDPNLPEKCCTSGIDTIRGRRLCALS